MYSLGQLDSLTHGENKYCMWETLSCHPGREREREREKKGKRWREGDTEKGRGTDTEGGRETERGDSEYLNSSGRTSFKD